MSPTKIKNHEATAHRRRLIRANVRMKYSKPPSVDTFEEEMTKRFIVASEAPANQQWMFINSIAVISSDQPSVEFFNEVRRIQAEGCRRTKTLFPRQVRKSVMTWDPHMPHISKYLRYVGRCLCFNGLMLFQRQIKPHHEWKIVEAEAKKAALKTAMPTIDSQQEKSATGRSQYPETVPIPPPIVPA